MPSDRVCCDGLRCVNKFKPADRTFAVTVTDCDSAHASMSHPRKKVRVFHIPQDETISVTRISSPGSGHQAVTQISLPVPWQDDAAEPGTTPPAPLKQANPTSHNAESPAKKRYVSTVSCMLFSSLCFCFALFCVCFRASL